MNTPKELLETLRLVNDAELTKEAMKRPHQTLSDCLSRLSSDPELLEEKDESNQTDISWGRVLLNMVLARLSEEYKSLFLDEEHFAFGILDIPEVNAKAFRAPNGGWLVIINYGLI